MLLNDMSFIPQDKDPQWSLLKTSFNSRNACLIQLERGREYGDDVLPQVPHHTESCLSIQLITGVFRTLL